MCENCVSAFGGKVKPVLQNRDSRPTILPKEHSHDAPQTSQSENRPTAAGSFPPPSFRKMDAYWRACNYLCAGMIYLRDNPFAPEAAAFPNIARIACLGHWGLRSGPDVCVGFT